jgi:transglutaminase-like putative cysteine protease
MPHAGDRKGSPRPARARVLTLILTLALAPLSLCSAGADPADRPVRASLYGCPTPATEFTAPSELIQSDNETAVLWAAHITESAGAETETEKIRAICAWYAKHLSYDSEAFLRARELPAGDRAANIPRHDHLSVLAAAAEHAAGLTEDKPASLCGGYVYGAAGSLRALGIPVRIEIGKVERVVQKGERYCDATGALRRSDKGGETSYTRLADGRFVPIADLHARLRVWDEARGLWMHADPAFASASGDTEKYLDMSETDYAERWTFLYTASERAPLAWKENPLPEAKPVPPPRP